MSNAATFPYVMVAGSPPTLRPILPILLTRGGISIQEDGLVDSGADVSILLYNLGLRLGLDWQRQPSIPSIGGLLSGFSPRGVILDGSVNPFSSVRLAFAWVQSDDIPLILGRTNFFMEFDVSFFRSRNYFQIQPRTP